MRSHEFIAEVPMNPAAYAQSVETGAKRGVLVGYEFEVCVPEETIKGASAAGDPNAWVKQMPTDWYDYIGIGENDSYVALTRPIEYQGREYKSLYDLWSSWRSNLLEEPVKKIFMTIPERDRKKIIANWNKDKDSYIHGNDITGFARYLRSWSADRRDRANDALRSEQWHTVVKSLYKEIDQAQEQKFWKEVFGTTKLKELVQNPVLHFNGDVITAELSDEYADFYDQDYDYKGATKVLKPALEQAFGTVKVFDEYHQKKKDATSWYIEPDGSLEPQDNDGAAEVVSPPLPVKQAIDALKTFYGIANQLKLYTNSSTGLHINVSVPDNLDVMKLAVFLGDEHVLASWGRLNNEYAQSVMQSIRDDTGFTLKNYNPATKKGFKILQNIVKNISDDHMASISYNGKYVSFRHTGGDYLKDYSSVANVVGRFVRAMVIASDPNAYRKEYMTKLTKLLTRDDNPAGQGLGSINALRTQPIKILATVIYGVNRHATTQKLINAYRQEYWGNYTIASPAFAQQLANQNFQKIYGQVRPETQEAMNQFAKNGVVVAILHNDKDVTPNTNIKALYNNAGKRLGIYNRDWTTIAPGTPEHNDYINMLLAQYKAQAKQKMAPQRPSRRR